MNSASPMVRQTIKTNDHIIGCTVISTTIFFPMQCEPACKLGVSARNCWEGGRILDAFSVALGHFGIANAIQPLLVNGAMVQEC